MISAAGVRIGWSDLPTHVRAGVEAILGARVVSARSQAGGFSPGTADRVRTADGHRAFVKAVSPAQNAFSPAMHRREARITAALPDLAPVPRLLGCYDDGEWVALALTDVPGRHPATPWIRSETANVLSTLERLATVLTPCPIADVAPAAEQLREDFAGWRRIATDPPAGGLDPWAAGNLDALCRCADRGLAALAGNTLCHVDIRADNLLIGPDGSVVVVDWPHACRGPAWLDALMLLVNVRLYGGQDSEALLHGLEHTAGTDPDDVTGVLAAMAGYFLDAARLPDPPGLPTVRRFQRLQGEATMAWLRERL